MTDNVKVEVKGLKETQQKMTQVVRDLTGNPMQAGMAKATLIVQRSAAKDAPVDRGVLRASIHPEVAVRANVIQGIVGSNVKYAPMQELGTRPFTPPWTPIFQWAMRKTKGDRRSAGALAAGTIMSIRARGIKAKRFLQDAIEKNAGKIYRILNSAVSRIVNK
jgi:hypothetical protein